LVLKHQRVHTIIQRHLEDVAHGALRVVVDRTFPLAEATAKHAFIESRQAFRCVVLLP
jgi:NADPH:quinone reductase